MKLFMVSNGSNPKVFIKAVHEAEAIEKWMVGLTDQVDREFCNPSAVEMTSIDLLMNYIPEEFMANEEAAF